VQVLFNQTITRLASTNGHVCGIFVYEPDEPNEGASEFIVPLPELKMLKPVKGLDLLTIEYDADTKRGNLHVLGGASVAFNAIDGKFPDLSRVIPSKATTGQAAQFNTAYIAAFTAAAKALNPKKDFFEKVKIWHNGDDCATVTLTDERYLGLLMPLNQRLCGAADGFVPSPRFSQVIA